MAATTKNASEIARVRTAGEVVALARARPAEQIAPGVTTRELDGLARQILAEAGARSSFLGHRGLRGHGCTSVDDEAAHGVPGGRTPGEGDSVSIGVGAFGQGFHRCTVRAGGRGGARRRAGRLDRAAGGGGTITVPARAWRHAPLACASSRRPVHTLIRSTSQNFSVLPASVVGDVQVAGRQGEANNEGGCVRHAALRALQSHPPEGRDPGHLQ